MQQAIYNRFPELSREEASILQAEMTRHLLAGKSEFEALWYAAQGCLKQAQLDMSNLQTLVNGQKV